jgi:hypothetical protein
VSSGGAIAWPAVARRCRLLAIACLHGAAMDKPSVWSKRLPDGHGLGKGIWVVCKGCKLACSKSYFWRPHQHECPQLLDMKKRWFEGVGAADGGAGSSSGAGGSVSGSAPGLGGPDVSTGDTR